MNTYPLYNPDGRMFAFEIEIVYIGVKKIAKLLNSCDGVSDIRVRKIFGADSDIHIDFLYAGNAFIVWEPYADSSRYWIGPKDDANKQIDFGPIESVFRQYRPSTAIKLLGDLVSFKFLSAIKRKKG
jgi:hypothetical protein